MFYKSQWNRSLKFNFILIITFPLFAASTLAQEEINEKAMSSANYLFTINANTSSVELLSFDGNFDDGSIHLKWNTLSEIDNDFFTVEKSTDGLNWDFVEQIDGAGLSNTLNNYTSADDNPYNGICYYRLKQTNTEGISTALKIFSINANDWLSNKTSAFPNPTTDALRITGSFIGKNDWGVFDRYGRNVLNQVRVLETSKDFIVLDLSSLASDDYYFISKNEREHLIKL